MSSTSPVSGSSRTIGWLLALVLLGAALLRLPYLASVPPGLIPDESMSGYDSWSIARTGRDQQGVWMPLYPRSTAGLHSLYQFLAVPFVAALGPDEVGIRLPGALAGITTVALLFTLVARIGGPGSGLMAALLLAVSPWHVLISRTGVEWVLLPLMMLLTLVLTLRAIDGRSWLLAGLAAGASLYTYTPIRLSLPLLLFGVALVHRPALLRQWRPVLAGMVVALLVALPQILFSLGEQGMSRLDVVGTVAASPLEAARSFGSHYAAAFSPAFLFEPAREPELHRLRSTGLLHWFEAPLIVVGICRALRERRPDGLIVLWWLAVGPLAVSIHKDSPDPILGLTSLPATHALGGIGAAWLIDAARRAGGMRLPLLAAAGLIVAGFTAAMARDLYRQFPVYAAEPWGHGVREAVAWAETQRYQYDDVIVDVRATGKLVYGAILIHARYDPATRQREEAAFQGRAYRAQVGQYLIGSVEELAAAPGRHLVWTTPREARRLFPGRRPLHVVPWPDGRPHYVLVDVERQP